MSPNSTSYSSHQTKMSGFFLVGLAALLWSTDSLFRYPILKQIDPFWIVFIEHLLGILLLGPLVFKTNGFKMFQLTAAQWLAALFCGAGGSALATLLFTASFRYVNPSVSILIQKFQSIFVACFAYLFLKERPEKKFYFLATVAIVCGILLSFPDLKFNFISKDFNLRTRGVQYAFSAALLWAIATVSGKKLVHEMSPTLATFWRFFFGSLVLVLGITAQPSLSFAAFWQRQSETLFMGKLSLALLYLSLIPGLLAMVIYYVGLKKIKASHATLVELIYPIGGVLLNTLILDTPLTLVQLISGGLLLLSVTWLSF